MANIFEILLAEIRREVHKPIYTSPSRTAAGREEVWQDEKKQQSEESTLVVRAAQVKEQKPVDITEQMKTAKMLMDEAIQEINTEREVQVEQNMSTNQDMHEISELTTERTIGTVEKLDKEDFLLNQIDEFREKAKQLQNLLLSKESKALELQSLVNERQDKAQELEALLNARQEEADQIMKDFNQKVDELTAKVTYKMTEMEASISHQVSQAKNASVAQLEANRKLNEAQIEASKKLNEEQLAKNKQFLEEQAIANKKLSEGQIAEVKVLLDTATTQLDSIKTDLSEKVHSENVKCYRNIQDLFTEFDSKIEKMDEMEKGVDAIRGYVKCLTWFSIINFVVLIGFILYSLGVFNF